MNEPPTRYDVTVTVDGEGGCLPDPAEFAVAAGRAASSRGASVVIVQTVDRFSAVAVALAVVSEALRRPAASLSR